MREKTFNKKILDRVLVRFWTFSDFLDHDIKYRLATSKDSELLDWCGFHDEL